MDNGIYALDALGEASRTGVYLPRRASWGHQRRARVRADPGRRRRRPTPAPAATPHPDRGHRGQGRLLWLVCRGRRGTPGDNPRAVDCTTGEVLIARVAQPSDAGVVG